MLTDAVTGGVWSSNNTAIATVGPSSDTVVGRSSGVAVISYTIPSTGCTTFTTVLVNPLPNTFGPIGPICQGDSITVTDPPSAGTWSNRHPGIDVLTQTGGFTASIRGVSPGVDTITFTLPTGCLVSDTVLINPIVPITGVLSVCVGSTTTLSDLTPGGAWSSLNLL